MHTQSSTIQRTSSQSNSLAPFFNNSIGISTSNSFPSFTTESHPSTTDHGGGLAGSSSSSSGLGSSHSATIINTTLAPGSAPTVVETSPSPTPASDTASTAPVFSVRMTSYFPQPGVVSDHTIPSTPTSIPPGSKPESSHLSQGTVLELAAGMSVAGACLVLGLGWYIDARRRRRAPSARDHAFSGERYLPQGSSGCTEDNLIGQR